MFLWKLAEHELSTKEQFHFGLLLEVATSTMHQIRSDCQDAVISTFSILEAWRNSRIDIEHSSALYDQLCRAYVELKKTDVAEYIRSGEIVIGVN